MSTTFLNDIHELQSKFKQAQKDMGKVSEVNILEETVIKINPDEINNWEFRDRQEFELGNIDELAESILLKGQAQPIIIVKKSNIFKPINDANCKYVVIAGYRRWLACKSRNLSIDAIVRDLSFEQAVGCLVSENEKEQVSDYSKGMFYSNLLKREQVKKVNLYERLGINRGVFDNYLSFAEVPSEVWNAVKVMNKISARTAATIKYICQKGDAEKNAILEIADQIATGIGEKKITALVNKILFDKKNKVEKNATRVAFSKNVFIEIKNDSLVVTAKKVKAEHMHKLKEQLSEILDGYIKEESV